MPGVVSVFPNTRRSLHTTHSWDFMGLLGEETMEVPGYSTKNQVNVIIGFIDTGNIIVRFIHKILVIFLWPFAQVYALQDYFCCLHLADFGYVIMAFTCFSDVGTKKTGYIVFSF